MTLRNKMFTIFKYIGKRKLWWTKNEYTNESKELKNKFMSLKNYLQKFLSFSHFPTFGFPFINKTMRLRKADQNSVM